MSLHVIKLKGIETQNMLPTIQVIEILVWKEFYSLYETTTRSVFFSIGASGENASSIDACIRKSLSFQKLRGPETNDLLSVDCITRSRPSSFHEIELSPVPEVAVPPQEESVDTEESSRSTSPSSSRVRHIFLLLTQRKYRSYICLLK